MVEPDVPARPRRAPRPPLAQFTYGNDYLYSEPAIVRFPNDRFYDDNHPWRQGLNIYNPEALTRPEAARPPSQC